LSAGEIKAFVSCLITAALSVLFVIVLDSFTGVSFNYAVPIALVAALFPFAVLLRRRLSQRTDKSFDGPRPRAGTAQFVGPRERQARLRNIHSVVIPITGKRAV